MARKSEVLTIPVTVFETAESKEDLEDWLLAKQPDFIRAMRRARKQDLEGKCEPLEAVRRRLLTR